MPDSRFGRYELLELVSRGPLGFVYRARDMPLDRTVALRIIPREAAHDPVARARLNREAKALASVDHPNVAPIYETGERDGRVFIATRWIDGVSLHAFVRAEGPLDPRRAVRLVNQIASALQAAHAHGLMHRNVKPSSVLVTAGDVAYLTDFNLARSVTDLTGLTVADQLVGTFDFVAPEYISGGVVDARADIYGLGCLLYVALTGEVPYPKSGAAAKAYAQRSAEPPSPRALRPDIPVTLDAVARRAMAKDPDARPQTAGEFAIDAAGAISMSSPPWAMLRSPSGAVGREPAHRPQLIPFGAHDGDVDHDPERSPAADGPYASTDEGYDEPVFYVARGGRTRRLALWLAAIVVFAAAPVALLANMH